MSSRRKNRNKETQIPIKKKKKLSCKRRCRRWCFRQVKRCIRCFFRKFTRCCKRLIFGKKNPRQSGFSFFRRLLDKLTGQKPSEIKIKLSKVNSKDIEKVKAIKVTELEKNYSLTGSQLKVLVELVQDFEDGNISASETPRRRIPFRKKQISKQRLQEMIKSYDEAKKERDAELVKSKPKKQWWDIFEDLNADKLPNVTFFRAILTNLKYFNNENTNLTQLSDALQQGRGVSFIIPKSQLPFMSKAKLQELLENLKEMHV